MILAIETSASICSVVFYKDGKTIASYSEKAPMRHAELTGQFVEKGLSEIQDRELQAVAIATGPGSFTGLRIGLSYAQGFCYGRDLPIIGISNHQVLAKQINSGKPLYSVIDARRNEVYLAKHQNNDTREILEHKTIHIEDVPEYLPAQSCLIFHEDINVSDELINQLKEKQIEHHLSIAYDAAILADIANARLQQKQFDDVETIEPMYIRPFAGLQ
jgi:tRNA threonylcarbamoyladenosine biosynthesis protein TsaB